MLAKKLAGEVGEIMLRVTPQFLWYKLICGQETWNSQKITMVKNHYDTLCAELGYSSAGKYGENCAERASLPSIDVQAACCRRLANHPCIRSQNCLFMVFLTVETHELKEQGLELASQPSHIDEICVEALHHVHCRYNRRRRSLKC